MTISLFTFEVASVSTVTKFPLINRNFVTYDKQHNPILYMSIACRQWCKRWCDNNGPVFYFYRPRVRVFLLYTGKRLLSQYVDFRVDRLCWPANPFLASAASNAPVYPPSVSIVSRWSLVNRPHLRDLCPFAPRLHANDHEPCHWWVGLPEAVLSVWPYWSLRYCGIELQFECNLYHICVSDHCVWVESVS